MRQAKKRMRMEGAASITIDLDKPCQRCGKKGATPGGLCLKCITKKISSRTAARMDAHRDE